MMLQRLSILHHYVALIGAQPRNAASAWGFAADQGKHVPRRAARKRHENTARAAKHGRRQAAVCAALAILLAACTASAEPPPDVVLIVADDLRHDDIAHMPRVTELAEQGVVFDGAFTPFPLCVPARVSLLTGTLPRTHGFRANDPTGFDGTNTIATRLRAGGYRTGVFGKLLNNLALAGPQPGWSVYLPFVNHKDYGRAQSDVLTAQALEFMGGPGPSFTYLAPVAPHGPLYGPERCDSRSIPPAPEGSTVKRWKQRLSALCGLDDLVAAVVAARGPDTYVIFTADNGWMWENGRTGKLELIIDAAQVPLIVWGPGLRGHHRREMVSLVDVSATVLHLAGVSRSGIEGQSILGLLRESPNRWAGRLEIEGQ